MNRKHRAKEKMACTTYQNILFFIGVPPSNICLPLYCTFFHHLCLQELKLIMSHHLIGKSHATYPHSTSHNHCQSTSHSHSRWLTPFLYFPHSLHAFQSSCSTMIEDAAASTVDCRHSALLEWGDPAPILASLITHCCFSLLPRASLKSVLSCLHQEKWPSHWMR